jgi:aminoglycoside phosphotransferase (APT) family kinase protein
MTSGQPTDERPPRDLIDLVRDRFGVTLRESDEGIAGEESIGWRGSSADGDRFVQRFPIWRRIDELDWCDAVARTAATAAPVCVHACLSVEGRRAVATPDGPVMVFPFVEGAHPEPGGSLNLEAAWLLAAIHRGLASSWVGGERPRGDRRSVPWDAEPRSELVDPDLDEWERTLEAERPGVPIHGDFYAGNLLAVHDRISGVIDWWDARLGHREQEVAWAAWEFCQNDRGEDLVDADAAAFLDRYVEAGGPAPVGAAFDPLPWIRLRLRWEARAWFSDPRSRTERSDYHDAQLVAFERLRSRGFEERG